MSTTSNFVHVSTVIITVVTGEKLSEEELDHVVKDCMDPEDEDGMIPYVRKYSILFSYVYNILTRSVYYNIIIQGWRKEFSFKR